MIVTLAISDDLYEKYREQDPAKPNALMIRQLERFKDVKQTDRPVVLTKEQQKQIETLFGEGIDGAAWEKFIRWLTARCSVNLGEQQITLSNSQWKRVQESARFFTSKNPNPEGDPASLWLKGLVEDYLRHMIGV